MKTEFSNGELNIVWRPTQCIHSRICVKTLPEVYHPTGVPWIKAENAETDALVRQIYACPSGALSYYFNQDEHYGIFSDNEEGSRYELEVEGQTAFIDYKKRNDRVYLIHTDVPKELEGKGVGSRLVLQSLVDIKKRELRLVAYCPFVVAYLKKYPDWKEIELKRTKS